MTNIPEDDNDSTTHRSVHTDTTTTTTLTTTTMTTKTDSAGWLTAPSYYKKKVTRDVSTTSLGKFFFTFSFCYFTYTNHLIGTGTMMISMMGTGSAREGRGSNGA
jgi:hypothetical protein